MFYSGKNIKNTINMEVESKKTAKKWAKSYFCRFIRKK